MTEKTPKSRTHESKRAIIAEIQMIQIFLVCLSVFLPLNSDWFIVVLIPIIIIPYLGFWIKIKTERSQFQKYFNSCRCICLQNNQSEDLTLIVADKIEDYEEFCLIHDVDKIIYRIEVNGLEIDWNKGEKEEIYFSTCDNVFVIPTITLIGKIKSDYPNTFICEKIKEVVA